MHGDEDQLQTADKKCDGGYDVSRMACRVFQHLAKGERGIRLCRVAVGFG